MPKTIETKVYTFEELSEAAKAKAFTWGSELNVDYPWWSDTYADAENIGLRITSFDSGYRQEICGDLTTGEIDVAEKIMKEHGKDCETYKIAAAYLEARKAIECKPENLDTDEELTYEAEKELGELNEEFHKDLLAEYLAMLGREYDYRTSTEAITETILANEYTFTEDGQRFD